MKADQFLQPQLWQLRMEVSSTRLAALAASCFVNVGAFYEDIPLTDSGSFIESMENTIYNNPGLFSDFSKVSLLYDTTRVLPSPPASEQEVIGLFKSVFPPAEDKVEYVVTHLPEMNLSLCFDIPLHVFNFLQRTFPNIELGHPLLPLLRYFRAKNAMRRRGKTLANLCGNRLDIITLGEKAPLSVSSHIIESAMDALYYIMTAREKLSLSQNDEIIVAGDRVLRTSITPMLRRYVRFVMPAFFPSALLQAGRNVLSAPFELAVQPLLSSS